MNADEWMFFEGMPRAFPLYEAFVGALRARFGAFEVRVRKTQISFANRYHFACVWLPKGRIKGCPETSLGVSFGLGYRVEDPRIARAAEPYPNRWTHHVIIQSGEEIDAQLMDWIRQAYDFAMSK
ncbi:MAG TPA: DUF5655 domain-containing protein [Clostridia bacterium]|nr:DUF5655 domain-containing protein [Clostridia bacterium]